jgi:ComEC/Rec2-related protein
VRTGFLKSLELLTLAQKVSIILMAATLLALVVRIPQSFLIIVILSVGMSTLVGIPLLIQKTDRFSTFGIFIMIFLLAFIYVNARTMPFPYPLNQSLRARIRLVSYPTVRGRNLQFRAVVLGIEDESIENLGVKSGPMGLLGRIAGRRKVLYGMPFPKGGIGRGDIIEAEGMFFGLPRERNPGFARYLQTIGIEAIYEGYRSTVLVLDEAEPPSPSYLARQLKRYIEKVHKGLLPPPQDSFATALLTGNRDLIPDELMESFRVSGTMHILAVSGLHVGFLSLFLLFLLRLIRVPKFYAYVLLGLFIVFFMVFIGEKPSVRRASLMALCGIACFLFDRDRTYLNVLALAFVILWVLNPFSLLGPGFLLSFCATFGILFLTPQLYKYLRRFMPQFLAGSIAVTLSVQLFIFPVMASFFGTFAYINVIANLPIVPLTGVSLALGVLTLVLYSVFLPLAVITAEVNTVIIATIVRLAALFARVPPLRIGAFPAQLIPVYLACVTALLWFGMRALGGKGIGGEEFDEVTGRDA